MQKHALRLLIALLVCIGVGLFLYSVKELVIYMGHEIPQENLAKDYVLGITWAMLLGLSILMWPVKTPDRRLLAWGWAAKSLVTLGLMLLYENHYSLDAYDYYDKSRLASSGDIFPRIGGGAETVYYLTWLHQQILPDSYHMMKVTFSMVGFIALYLFYRAGVQFLNREEPKAFWGLVLFPSDLFWSSILGKDPCILLGIALYVYGVANWYRKGRLHYLALTAFGVFETMFIRIWMGPILVAPLSVFVLRRMRGLLPRILFSAFVIAAFFSAINRSKASFNIQNKEDLLSAAQSVSHSWAHGGSGQYLETSFTSIGQLIRFLPLGTFTALFRPLPGELMGPFPFIASLENLLLLILLVRGLFKTRFREWLEPPVAWAVTLIVTWSSVYGLVSYQNLGSAARFKLQILPVLVGLLLYINRRRALEAANVPANV